MASKIIYFGHITSYGESGFNSSGAVPAVELAVEHVNNNTSILAGYKLVSTPVMDSEVSYYSTVEMHLGSSIFAHVLHTYSNHTLPPPSRTPFISCPLGCTIFYVMVLPTTIAITSFVLLPFSVIVLNLLTLFSRRWCTPHPATT